MNTMQENAAQRYIQANVRPPDPREVGWNAKPLPFKLYRNCEHIPLSTDTVIGTGLEPRTIPTAPVREASQPQRLSVDTQPDRDRRDSASCLFAPYGLSRGQIGQMLIDIYGLTRQSQSIAMFHPMLKYLPEEETQVTPFYISLLRPVPSGGVSPG